MMGRSTVTGMPWSEKSAVTVNLTAVEQTTWFMLFVLLPHIFMLLPRRPAAAVAVMMNLTPGVWLLSDQSPATDRTELATAHHQAGMLAERQRLSGEIHDTLAQGFTSILMLLHAAEPHAGEGARRPLELAARPPARTWPRRVLWSPRSGRRRSARHRSPRPYGG
jgi:signal transduction histidine kinase